MLHTAWVTGGTATFIQAYLSMLSPVKSLGKMERRALISAVVCAALGSRAASCVLAAGAGLHCSASVALLLCATCIT